MANESSYTASIAVEIKKLKDRIADLEAIIVQQGNVTAEVTAAMASADAQVTKVGLYVTDPPL